MEMEALHILISTVSPEKGKKIDTFDKHSKYIVKVLALFDCVLIQTLYGAWIKSNWLSNYSR